MPAVGLPPAFAPRPIDQTLVPHARTYAVKGMGTATVMMLGVAIVGSTVDTLWPLVSQDMARQALADNNVNLLNQARFSMAMAKLPYVGALVIAAVMVIIWLWRTRKNLDAFPEAEPSMGAGWAIGGWFVPVANLFIPGRMMASVVRDSLPGSGGAVAMVWTWWFGWIAGNGMDWMLGRGEWKTLPSTISGPEDYQAYVDYFGQAVASGMPGMIITAAGGLVLCILIWRVSSAQDDRIHAAAPPPVMPGAVITPPAYPVRPGRYPVQQGYSGQAGYPVQPGYPAQPGYPGGSPHQTPDYYRGPSA